MSLSEEDDLFFREKYCGGEGYWYQRSLESCLSGECSEDPMAACQCFDRGSVYRPGAWFAERKKINDSSYLVLVRGVSQADCGLGGSYVSGELKVNPSSGWEIAEVVKCVVSDDMLGRGSYCSFYEDGGSVRFASGSGCGSCCACQDGGELNIEVRVERVSVAVKPVWGWIPKVDLFSAVVFVLGAVALLWVVSDFLRSRSS